MSEPEISDPQGGPEKTPAEVQFDRISVAVLTATRDDMRKLGEILSSFEKLGKIAASEGREDVPDAVRAGDAVGTALMFDDTARKHWDQAMDIFSRLASCCQEVFRGNKMNRPVLSRIYSDIREQLEIVLEGGEVEEAPPAAVADKSMALDQDKELYTDFITESMEHLDSIEVKMVDLEAAPDDSETLNAIFRAFHTIKGVSGFLNLRDVNELAHRTETLLDMARRNELPVTGPVIDVIFEAIDGMKGMVRDVSEKVSAGAPTREFIGTDRIVARITAVQEGREDSAPGTRAASIPPRLGDVLVEQGKITQAEIDATLSGQADGAERQPLGMLLVEEKKISPKDVAQAIRIQKNAANAIEAQDIRVNIHKLDGLVDMVGELVIAQSLVCNDPDVMSIDSQRFYRNLSQLGRITSELQKISMSLRMVPIRATFQKMSRMVRDLAKKSGKEVTLLMEGEDTEIDRNMIEEIHDPLVHMIRNSVDHGVEKPDVRLAANKSACGTVTLRAFHHGGNVVIAVEDDGRGLDPEKILAKGQERGVVPAGASLSESEIFALLFEPGFSTAEKITDISGRGVGLDVVKRNVEKLRGTIETRSLLGQGSTFQMKFPLTLAIIDGIVVRVGEQRYILPTNSIVEALRPPREDYLTVEQRAEIIRVREELLPLIRLHRLFSIPEGIQDPCDGLVVVIESEGQKRAVLVDELLGKQEVVIKTLGGGMANVRGISGGAIMGDGRVGLILDVSGIFEITGKQPSFN
ncbi:MAG TPA: chemotaxis protein CheA [Candidatus Deferrimicrobiaceae bacterium]|jgi:two-component system chemotaxis sensor kinase CheA